MSEALNDAARGIAGGKDEPDPSVATTQAILREISNSKEVFTIEIAALKRAIDLEHADRNRWPTVLERELGNVEKLFDAKLEVHLEKLRSLQTQLMERDTRTEQMASASAKAIDAAFLAQKSAVIEQQLSNDKATEKAASSTNKMLDQQAQLLDVTKTGLNERIDALKENLGSIHTTLASISTSLANRVEYSRQDREVNREGREHNREGREGLAIWFGAMGAILAVISGVVLLIKL